MKPRKDFKLLAKTTRAAEIAVGLVVPDALPSARITDPTTSGAVGIEETQQDRSG